MTDINCVNCGTSDTHTYEDYFVCFKCKHKIIVNKNKFSASTLIKREPTNSFSNKSSGNKHGEKRYFPGLKNG